MIEPALADDAFLADVAGAPAATCTCGGSARAASCIKRDGRYLLLDPYLSDSLTEKYAGTPTRRTCA